MPPLPLRLVYYLNYRLHVFHAADAMLVYTCLYIYLMLVIAAPFCLMPPLLRRHFIAVSPRCFDDAFRDTRYDEAAATGCCRAVMLPARRRCR